MAILSPGYELHCKKKKYFQAHFFGGPGWGAQNFQYTVFHQQKLSSLSIACDVKLEGALYSVFYAEASEIP